MQKRKTRHKCAALCRFYGVSSTSELKKVVWPTSKQVGKNTLVALVMMALSAIVLGGFDWLAGAAVNALITLVG